MLSPFYFRFYYSIINFSVSIKASTLYSDLVLYHDEQKAWQGFQVDLQHED